MAGLHGVKLVSVLVLPCPGLRYWDSGADMTKRELIEAILDLLEHFPSGIDYEADPDNQSPEDMTAHTAGLIWQLCEREKK